MTHGTESSGFDRTTLVDGCISDSCRLLATCLTRIHHGRQFHVKRSKSCHAGAACGSASGGNTATLGLGGHWCLPTPFRRPHNPSLQVLLVRCVVLLVLPASATLGQSRFRVPAVPALGDPRSDRRHSTNRAPTAVQAHERLDRWKNVMSSRSLHP